MEREKRSADNSDQDDVKSRKRKMLDDTVSTGSGTADNHENKATVPPNDMNVLPVAHEAPPKPKRSGDEQETDEKAVDQKDATAKEAAITALILEEDLQSESGFLSFPEKLMALLEGGEVIESMWWLPEGDSFCIVPASFETILDKHFQGTKFESFTRKLNRWGFKRVAGQKVPVNTIAYFHHDFRQGQRDQLKDMSGSKSRIQACRELRTQQQMRQSIELGEAATIAERQQALYAAQQGVPPGETKLSLLYPDVPDSYLADGETKERRMRSIIETNQQSVVSQELRNSMGPSSTSELQMRLLRAGGLSAIQGGNHPGATSQLFARDANDSGSQVSESMLASLTQRGRVADQLRARELTNRLMLSQDASSSGNAYPSSTNDMHARLFAQTYGQAQHQMDTANLMGHQQQLNASSDFANNRLLNQSTQQGMLPNADRSGSLVGTDASFDILGGNRDYRNYQSLQSSPSRMGQWSQVGLSSQDQLPPYETEQLLQLYMLQQQQQRDQQQRDRAP